jgi:hypothetical protein
VEENHFVIIANPASDTSSAVSAFRADRTLFSHALGKTGKGAAAKRTVIFFTGNSP